MSTMTPQEIVSELDKHIVGQNNAKKAVAIALRNRWRRSQVAEPLRLVGMVPRSLSPAAFEAELQAGVTATIDGRQQPVWYSMSVRRAEPAHAGAEAVAVLTDISHLKRQQGELERLLRERDLMFNLSEVGIAWVRGRHIERANAAMSELTGSTAATASTRSTAAPTPTRARAWPSTPPATSTSPAPSD